VQSKEDRPRPFLRLAAVISSVILLAAICVATSALADEGEVGTGSQTPVLTPALIQEAISSPQLSGLGAPPTDSQAAEQLPHDELGRGEALHLVSAVFGAEIEHPAGLLDQMPGAHFLSEHAAVMPADEVAAALSRGEETESQAGVQPVLVESSVPLRTEDSEGTKAPVDLSLEPSEGALEPANPIVATSLPTALGEGIELANGSVELTFPEASEERSPTLVEGDSSGFYPNVEEDSDLLVSPVAGGVETLTQMRTPQAPRTQTVHVSLPEGAELKANEMGGAEATLNGRTILNVAPPSAIDAAGDIVPMTLAVSGADVELTISPDQETKFPVLADPLWTMENYNFRAGSFAGWNTAIYAPSYKALTYAYPTTDMPALDLVSGFPGGATPNTGAQWQYWVPRYQSDMAKYGEAPQSYIENVFTEEMMFLLEENKVAEWPGLVAGILDPGKGEWVSNLTWTGKDGEFVGWSGHASFKNYEETGAKVFVYGLITLENEAQAKYRQALAGKATVEVTDHNSPEIQSLSGPGEWANTGQQPISYSALDYGLGVQRLEVVPPGGSLNAFGFGSNPEFKVGTCTGTSLSPCPREAKSGESGSPAVTVDAGTAPEGVDKYTLAAIDPLYSSGFSEGPVRHAGEGQFLLQIDHSPPSVALSGSITEQGSLGTAQPTYTLKYNATDGVEESPTFATSYGTEGSGNGQLFHPADVSRDGSGDMWVADRDNNRIEELSGKGEYLALIKEAGSGSPLSHPSGIELDPSGNVWVADTGNNRIVEFNSKGEWMRKIGHLGSGNGEYSAPQGIAVDSAGNVWIADTGNNRIQELSSTGSFIRAFGTKGSGEGQLSEPTSLDVGPGGKVWVADAASNRIEVFNETGGFVASYGSLGSGNRQFNHPSAIDVDTGGSVWVADQNNGRVEQLSERGEYLGQFGTKGTGAGQFTFSNPAGLTTSSAGKLWVVDPGDNRVEQWTAPQGTRSGVRQVAVKVDGKAVQQPAVTCPQGGCPLAGEWTLYSGEYPAGAHTMEVTATDGVGLTTTQKQSINLSLPPNLSLSGMMTEQDALGTRRASYTLKANGTDGLAGAHQARVASAEVKLDGKTVIFEGKQAEEWAPKCAAEGCPLSAQWTLDASSVAEGKHTVEVIATDIAGHKLTPAVLPIETISAPAPSATLSGSITEEATLGNSRPRYILKAKSSALAGGFEAPTLGATPAYLSSVGTSGTGNGQFANPTDVATDASGNVWALDKNQDRIQEFNEKGEWIRSAGAEGSGGGKLISPAAIATDPHGNPWVLDTGNSRVLEFNAKGEFVQAIGMNVNKTKVEAGATEAEKNLCTAASGNVCQAATSGSAPGQLNAPKGIAITSGENVWVVDTGNNRLEKFSPEGKLLKNISGPGSEPGKLKEPTAITTPPDGSIWVADTGNNRIEEWNSSVAFVRAVATANGETFTPTAIEADANGGIWVGDRATGKARVLQFDEAGTYISSFGSLGSGSGQFSSQAPSGLGVDGKGSIWVADPGRTNLQHWSIPGFPNYLSSVGSMGFGNGQFANPTDVATDASGNVWALDKNQDRIQEFNEKGEWIRAAGAEGSGGGKLLSPAAIATDPHGNPWVLDTGNNRVVEFNTKGEFVQAIGMNVNKTKVEAGATEAEKNLCTAASGNVCQAATSGSAPGQLSAPKGMAITSGENVWVVDTGNNRLQKFSPEGKLLKNISGPGSEPGKLKEPTAITTPPDGSIWVADTGNNRIEEWNSALQFVKVVGKEGTGGGEFKSPVAIEADSSGNLWVGDLLNNRVQEFAEGGRYRGQFGAPGSEKLMLTAPMGIAVDAGGTIWITDAGHSKIQRWAQETPRSEITTTAWIDAEAPTGVHATCKTSSCTIEPAWTLTSSAYSPGAHIAHLKTTDGLGRTTEKAITFQTAKDETKPTLEAGGELANAPEGWVQQESYGLNATATDSDYGVSSIEFKIDGQQVAVTSQSCLDGGCGETLSKQISMASYAGGAHAAELVAKDGAGNSQTTKWTINVDPEGHITTAEAEDTLEAVEETSDANLVGGSEEDGGIEGTALGIGLELTETGYAATGTAAPMSGGAEPESPMIVEIPEARVLYGCPESEESNPEAPQEPEEPEEAKEPEEAIEPETDQPCIAADESGDGGLEPVSVEPLGVAGTAAPIDLVEENAALSVNTAAAADTVIRPLNDGGMIFEAIRTEAAPETYSFRVTLGPRQELEELDSSHVQVAYSSGFPAFTIGAEPARDAVGSTVPTTLKKTAEDVVTLTVHYKEGHEGVPFVYPVVGGTGWEGGFRTLEADFGTSQPPTGEGEVEGEGEGVESWEVVRGSVVGPPDGRPGIAEPLEAGASSTPGHIFKFSECRYGFGVPESPPIIGPEGEVHRPISYLAEVLGNCMALLGKETPTGLPLFSGEMVRGYFHYIPKQWVWVNPNQLECPKWGPHKGKKVHCFARPWKTHEALTVRGDFRVHSEGGDLAECITIYGHLWSYAPYKERMESIISEEPADQYFEPCNWP
jgi:sugar lactone lactonase YvrE